jgi:hypothetical protein
VFHSSTHLYPLGKPRGSADFFVFTSPSAVIRASPKFKHQVSNPATAQGAASSDAKCSLGVADCGCSGDTNLKKRHHESCNKLFGELCRHVVPTDLSNIVNSGTHVYKC